MKTPLTPTKHDLYECRGKAVISTIATNLPYRLCRHKKMVMETLPNYPRGTFFVITPNGERPKL